jgi:hypothetical protein
MLTFFNTVQSVHLFQMVWKAGDTVFSDAIFLIMAAQRAAYRHSGQKR